ncbi:tryptophan dimethylallyltransferase-domain-containing protein [Annulohypoxylon bovei var. microspora]|nr:tryptophan dimethylallyltransferase-domain-containing protein [Annulohypoxylon bovei var. microspora]
MEKMISHEKESLEVTSFSPEALLSLILHIFKLGVELLINRLKPPIREPKTAWNRVTFEFQHKFNRHERYWWERSGYALAVLLQNAGYTYASQIKILDFFARKVVDSLGITHERGAERWKSFMTDDNNPIELSWDWHMGIERPTVRFSIEPTGLGAGTPDDPRNERAAAGFKQSILQALPDIDMSWFDHFEVFFRDETEPDPAEGQSSRVFWAFDLGEKDITSKAYFFPGYRARATNRSNLQVIAEAVASAPSCTPKRLSAFNIFAEFVNEHERAGQPPLELDMLAIDMVDCSSSRLKIYFRSRRTDFRSACETMSLGGRIAGLDMDEGLAQLRYLWDSLFDQGGEPLDTPLGPTSHRTAGILYNVEFRLDDKLPKAKIYIPVRHYARTDAQVIRSVSKFMNYQEMRHGETAGEDIRGCRREQASSARPSSSSPTSAYANAFNTIFTNNAISTSRGLHTYIACSVQTGGMLRVVSYINVQEGKLKHIPL